MALEITEGWIIERIQLEHDKLDDVKSLALPGTYHEKITGLGFSLQNFTRLQHLDLSKNNLNTLKGLEHLTLLEKLNLYYNKIQDLKEIFRLRKNQNLREIDLRLNPVTGNEPDYRLFIAHMLPLLRRLDDRPVRDTERKAALMHFSTNESLDMLDFEDSSYADKASMKGKSRQPRVNYVKSLVQKPTVVQSDDTVVDVIDYVNKNLSKPTNQIKKATKPTSQMHSREELVRIVRKETEKEELKAGRGDASRKVKFTRNEERDDNLKFKDEDEAYIHFKSFANFTPHPGCNGPPPTVNQAVEPPIVHSSQAPPSSTMISDEFKCLPECTKLSFGESTTAQEVHRRKNLTQIKFIESILDVVDRYWNGTKSLHYHQKFQSLIQKPLEVYQKELSAAREVQIKVLNDKLSNQQLENESLQNQLHTASSKISRTPQKSDELTHAQQELESTRSRLQLTISDNKILRVKISDLEGEMKASGDGLKQQNKERVQKLEEDNKQLVKQVESLKHDTEQYEKISQLATMLQNSHRSLVATNEHLLSELDDTRERHQSEIEQLKWSYDQLRSTSKLTNGHVIDEEL